MNQQEIKDKIQAEYDAFLELPFEKAELPEWFYKNFEGLFMRMNQVQVPYRAPTIISIVKKIQERDEESLTILEVQTIAQMWLSVPPDYLDKDINKFLVKRSYLESLMARGEFLKDQKTMALQKKAMTLNNIARK